MPQLLEALPPDSSPSPAGKAYERDQLIEPLLAYVG